jgi:farnesyl-diphosphate farnesyltransferase
MLDSTNLRGVCEIFLRYTRVIHKKSTPSDPNFLEISLSCARIEQFIESIFPSATTPTVAQLKLAAEKQERDKQKMTPEEKSDMIFVYVAIIGVWVVLFALMTVIAYLCGARFDHLWEGATRLWREVREGGITGGDGAGGARTVVEGTPGRVEL